MKLKKRLPQEEAELLGLKIKPKSKTEFGNPTYSITKEQWETISEHRDERRFVTVQQKFDKNGKITSSVDKLQDSPIQVPDNHEIVRISTNNTSGQQWVITKPKKEIDLEKDIDYSFIEELVQKHIKPIEKVGSVFKEEKTFDRIIYTDVHIGMTTNESGYALYGQKWDEEQLNANLKEMCLFVEQNCKSNILVIDDLGDFLDGWDGETTRKGHKLPQNMDNQTMFDVGVAFKIRMIDELINFYDEIRVNNICEDNHAGSFGYIVNSAFKMIIEAKYPNVSVTNHRKFINHYFIGKHCKVISHGKDSKSLKFGFKPHLDPKQIEKIDQYLKQNNIYKQADFIEFGKGDSHQLLLDYCTTDDFDYCNYGAFSPSSEWVQTNFKKGRNSFIFSVTELETNKSNVQPYFFN